MIEEKTNIEIRISKENERNNMKIYCGKNRKGVWKASLDKTKLSKFDRVFESEVETIHNDKVYMIQTYYRYDYIYGSSFNPIYDVVIHVPELFHSVSAAKKNEIWKERENLAKAEPEKYHTTPFSIASDNFGEPFVYEDVMRDKFNMKIIGIKVI